VLFQRRLRWNVKIKDFIVDRRNAQKGEIYVKKNSIAMDKLEGKDDGKTKQSNNK